VRQVEIEPRFTAKPRAPASAANDLDVGGGDSKGCAEHRAQRTASDDVADLK